MCRICLCLVPGSLLFLLVGWLQVRGDGEILSQVVSSQVRYYTMPPASLFSPLTLCFCIIGHAMLCALLIVLFCAYNIWKEDLLVRWGGVAPKMAEEAHSLAIDQVWLSVSEFLFNLAVFDIYVIDFVFSLQVVQKALDDANVSENDLSAVAVTVGPGRSLCLRGISFCMFTPDQ